MACPNFVLARMAVNIAINAILDEVPVVGDGLSIFFRSNKMNYELMEKYAHTKRQHSWGDRLFVTAILAGVALFPAVRRPWVLPAGGEAIPLGAAS